MHYVFTDTLVVLTWIIPTYTLLLFLTWLAIQIYSFKRIYVNQDKRNYPIKELDLPLSVCVAVSSVIVLSQGVCL